MKKKWRRTASVWMCLNSESHQSIISTCRKKNTLTQVSYSIFNLHSSVQIILGRMTIRKHQLDNVLIKRHKSFTEQQWPVEYIFIHLNDNVWKLWLHHWLSQRDWSNHKKHPDSCSPYTSAYILFEEGWPQQQQQQQKTATIKFKKKKWKMCEFQV